MRQSFINKSDKTQRRIRSKKEITLGSTQLGHRYQAREENDRAATWLLIQNVLPHSITETLHIRSNIANTGSLKNKDQ